MKKTRLFALVLALALLTLSACSNDAAPSSSASLPPQSEIPTPSQQAPMEASESATEPSSSQADAPETATNPPSESDEYGLPVMSEENQRIYDKYYFPLDITNSIFVSDFDSDQFEAQFLPSVLYSRLAKPKENARIPGDKVETLISQWFPIAAKSIREKAGRWDYDTETETYNVFPIDYEYTQNIRGAVISSRIEGDRLTVECEWNDTVYPENPSRFMWLATSTTVIILESDTKWFYESNKVVHRPYPGEEGYEDASESPVIE